MKTKTIILIIVALSIILLIKDHNIIIPKDSIRIRIISNSNSNNDLKTKMMIKEKVEDKLYSLLNGINSINDAENIIKNNLDDLNLLIQDISKDNYKIEYGSNYFPRKEYKGVIYEEGVYNSLVITLGEGKGNNWWCVLFPPLCLLDDNTKTKDVEYKLFVREIIEKLTK